MTGHHTTAHRAVSSHPPRRRIGTATPPRTRRVRERDEPIGLTVPVKVASMDRGHRPPSTLCNETLTNGCPGTTGRPTDGIGRVPPGGHGDTAPGSSRTPRRSETDATSAVEPAPEPGTWHDHHPALRRAAPSSPRTPGHGRPARPGLPPPTVAPPSCPPGPGTATRPGEDGPCRDTQPDGQVTDVVSVSPYSGAVPTGREGSRWWTRRSVAGRSPAYAGARPAPYEVQRTARRDGGGGSLRRRARAGNRAPQPARGPAPRACGTGDGRAS